MAPAVAGTRRLFRVGPRRDSVPPEQAGRRSHPTPPGRAPEACSFRRAGSCPAPVAVSPVRSRPRGGRTAGPVRACASPCSFPDPGAALLGRPAGHAAPPCSPAHVSRAVGPGTAVQLSPITVLAEFGRAARQRAVLFVLGRRPVSSSGHRTPHSVVPVTEARDRAALRAARFASGAGHCSRPLLSSPQIADTAGPAAPAGFSRRPGVVPDPRRSSPSVSDPRRPRDRTAVLFASPVSCSRPVAALRRSRHRPTATYRLLFASPAVVPDPRRSSPSGRRPSAGRHNRRALSGRPTVVPPPRSSRVRPPQHPRRARQTPPCSSRRRGHAVLFAAVVPTRRQAQLGGRTLVAPHRYRRTAARCRDCSAVAQTAVFSRFSGPAACGALGLLPQLSAGTSRAFRGRAVLP